MALLRDSADDLRALIATTAEHLEMPEVFVEKDYWVTELLRSVSAPVDDALVVFKGGTSLSKAARMIRRFSEDVDILLVMEPPGAGKGATDRALKEISARAAVNLGLTEERVTSSTGVHRTTSYSYEALYPPGPTATAVKLEMGTRGGQHPWSYHDLRSYIAEDRPDLTVETFDEMEPVRVRVLAPERTLVEKLSLLHSVSVGFPVTEAYLLKAGRHLYDVGRVLENSDVLDALAALDVPALCDEIEEVSAAEFGITTKRPEGGFAKSPVWNPDAPCADAVEEAYSLIDGLLLEPKPALHDIRERVRSHADLL